MIRRCLNCMEVFEILPGYESENNCCPFCGFVENTPPKYASYLSPGVLLDGRYTIGTVIGAGGFGITYRAWDNTLNTAVAIKEYYPQGIVSRGGNTKVEIYNKQEHSFEHGKSRFLKEARSLAQLNDNPRTVSIYDFFEENDTAYIVMEYLKGCNLKEYVEDSNNSLSYDLICTMADNICDALRDVHSIGLVHRDISLDNIYLCNDGTFKLIDFGAVKQSINDSNLSETVVLKHGYAPVEQYSKSGNIGPWTDIYALSATIYRLATGKVPQESIDRLSSDSVVPPKAINHQLPRNFSNTIMKGMAVQITDRYQRIEDFKRDLFRSDVEGFSGMAAGTMSSSMPPTYPTPIQPAVQPVRQPVSQKDNEAESGGFFRGPGGIIVIPLIAIFIMAAVIVFILFINKDSDDTESGTTITVADTDNDPETDSGTDVTAKTETETPKEEVDTKFEISEIKANTDEEDTTTYQDKFERGVKWVHFYWTLDKAPGEIKYKIEVDYNISENQRTTGSQVFEQTYKKGQTTDFTVYGNKKDDPIELFPQYINLRVYNADTDEYLGSKMVQIMD